MYERNIPNNIMACPMSNDFLNPYFPVIWPAGNVKIVVTNTNAVGIQFCKTLFIPNSEAIAGLPIFMPVVRKTVKNEVMNVIITKFFF